MKGMARVLDGIYDGAMGKEAEWRAGLRKIGAYLGAEAMRVMIRREGKPVSVLVEWPGPADAAQTVWSEQLDEQTKVTLDAEGPVDSQRMDELSLHLKRAVQLWFELAELRGCHAMAVGLLERLRGPVSMVDTNRLVSAANTRAEALLEQAEGCRLADGRLTSSRALENRRLEEAVARVAQSTEGDESQEIFESLVWQEATVSPLRLIVSPVAAVGRELPAELRRHSALVVFHHPNACIEVDWRPLRELYGFTVTEARIAARLAEGMSTTDIAEARRCSELTVRTHIKRLLRKTATNRQAELVALILGGPAGLVAK